MPHTVTGGSAAVSDHLAVNGVGYAERRVARDQAEVAHVAYPAQDHALREPVRPFGPATSSFRRGRLHFLDSALYSNHDDPMRTTVTLDEDTERMVRDAMRRTQRSFKVTLNEAIRNGLNRVSERRPAFRVRARPMGLRTGIDPARMHEREQEAEEERFLRVTDRAKPAAQ